MIHRHIEEFQKRIAGRLYIICQHGIGITPGDKDVGANDLCRIGRPQTQQFRRFYGKPYDKAKNEKCQNTR